MKIQTIGDDEKHAIFFTICIGVWYGNEFLIAMKSVH